MTPSVKSPKRTRECVRWELRFRELAKFYRQHGHFNPLPGYRLNHWVQQQCEDFRQHRMTPEHWQRLAGLVFSRNQPVNYSDAVWNRNFERLATHFRTKGHFKLFGGPFNLSLWVKKQRILKRMGQLRPDRQQRLEALGFTWAYPSRRAWSKIKKPATSLICPAP